MLYTKILQIKSQNVFQSKVTKTGNSYLKFWTVRRKILKNEYLKNLKSFLAKL